MGLSHLSARCHMSVKDLSQICIDLSPDESNTGSDDYFRLRMALVLIRFRCEFFAVAVLSLNFKQWNQL